MGGQLFAAALAELRNLASSARRALPYAPFDPVPVATKALDSHPQLKGRNTEEGEVVADNVLDKVRVGVAGRD